MVLMKNRIREFRELLGLTQEQLGTLVGVSRQSTQLRQKNSSPPSGWLMIYLKYLKAPSRKFLFLKKVNGNPDPGKTGVFYHGIKTDPVK